MEEFDVAFHHNIMVKRKKRLIVLMALDRRTALYDNDASDTATMRHYMRHYPYNVIDSWAKDWLDRLLYALPLRGLDAPQNNQTEVHRAAEGEERHLNCQDTEM